MNTTGLSTKSVAGQGRLRQLPVDAPAREDAAPADLGRAVPHPSTTPSATSSRRSARLTGWGAPSASPRAPVRRRASLPPRARGRDATRSLHRRDGDRRAVRCRRQADLPQTLDDMAVVSRVDEMEFTRAYRYPTANSRCRSARRTLQTYLSGSSPNSTQTTTWSAALVAPRQAGQGIHSGKSPVGLAAAAIYAGALLPTRR